MRRHLLVLPCYASIAAVLDSIQTRAFEESLGDLLSSSSTSLEPLNPQRPLDQRFTGENERIKWGEMAQQISEKQTIS